MLGEREGRYDLGEALNPGVGVLTFQGISICQCRPATSFLVNDGNLFSMYIETISCRAGDEHFVSEKWANLQSGQPITPLHPCPHSLTRNQKSVCETVAGEDSRP